jgi:quinolinate synthase
VRAKKKGEDFVIRRSVWCKCIWMKIITHNTTKNVVTELISSISCEETKKDRIRNANIREELRMEDIWN